MRCLQIAWGLAATLMGFLCASAPADAQESMDCPASTTMPQGGPQPTVSHQMLSDVCFIEQFPGVNLPILLYDDFSWRSFIALVWPAKDGQRGVPDSALALGAAAGRPAVFETLKSEWELFQKDGRDPTGWNEYGGLIPCDVPDLVFGDIVLAGSSKFENIIQSGGSGPLLGRSPIPGVPNDAAAFANTTMETFRQERVGGNGCMGCHNAAKSRDYVFSLSIRAFPRTRN